MSDEQLSDNEDAVLYVAQEFYGRSKTSTNELLNVRRVLVRAGLVELLPPTKPKTTGEGITDEYAKYLDRYAAALPAECRTFLMTKIDAALRERTEAAAKIVEEGFCDTAGYSLVAKLILALAD